MSNVTVIEISNKPDILRLAEEVKTTRKSRLLKRNGESVAILMPVGTAVKRKQKAKTTADYEAFRSAAGGWKDVDTDKLLEDIYAERQRTNKRPLLKI